MFQLCNSFTCNSLTAHTTKIKTASDYFPIPPHRHDLVLIFFSALCRAAISVITVRTETRQDFNSNCRCNFISETSALAWASRPNRPRCHLASVPLRTDLHTHWLACWARRMPGILQLKPCARCSSLCAVSFTTLPPAVTFYECNAEELASHK